MDSKAGGKLRRHNVLKAKCRCSKRGGGEGDDVVVLLMGLGKVLKELTTCI